MTTAALAASILRVVQMGRRKGDANPASEWASSTPVTVYRAVPSAKDSGEDTAGQPGQIPRPF